MRIPYRWLREFVESAVDAKAAAERLTMAGIETGLLGTGASELRGLVVAEVLQVAPHPAAATLQVCEVSTGGERYRVVCGAPNVRAGVRAAFAPPGASLPGGRQLAVATIRGTASEGMLCSEAELGVGPDASGILLLGSDAPVGADLVSHLGLDDAILEVEVTPNRPDCLAIVGVARELAALTGARLRLPDATVREDPAQTTAGWRISIEAPDLCPRYAARLITGVTVGPSPAWLAQRLREEAALQEEHPPTARFVVAEASGFEQQEEVVQEHQEQQRHVGDLLVAQRKGRHQRRGGDRPVRGGIEAGAISGHPPKLAAIEVNEGVDLVGGAPRGPWRGLAADLGRLLAGFPAPTPLLDTLRAAARTARSSTWEHAWEAEAWPVLRGP